MSNPVYATRSSKFQGDYGDEAEDTTKLLDSSSPIAEATDPKAKIHVIIGTFVAAAVLGVVVGGLVGGLPLTYTIPTTTLPTTTSSQSNVQYIGQSCTLSSQCIATSYCDPNSTVCTCSPQFYYDTNTGTCRARKGYGESCTTSSECEFNMLLLCSSSVCQCDSMLFWNP